MGKRVRLRAGAARAAIYLPISMRIALALGAAVVIWLGLFPGPMLEFARQSAADLGSIGGMFGTLGR